MKKLIMFSTALALFSGNVLGKVYFCPDPERIETARISSSIKKEGRLFGSKSFGSGKMQNQGLMFTVGRMPGGTINQLTDVVLLSHSKNKSNTLECIYHDMNEPDKTLASASTIIQDAKCKFSGHKEDEFKIKCDDPQKCKIICED